MGKAVLAVTVGAWLVVACGDGSLPLVNDGSFSIAPDGRLTSSLSLIHGACIVGASGTVSIEEDGRARPMAWTVDVEDGHADSVRMSLCCIRPTARVTNITGSATPCR
jgi:hypothetical protein